MIPSVITYAKLEKRTTKSALPSLVDCPFCGGRAEFRGGGNWDPRVGARVGVAVRCSDCKTSLPFRQGEHAYAISAKLWNRRSI